MEGLNCNKHTLKAYYAFLKLFYKDCSGSGLTPFLDDLYGQAKLEFADGPEYHAASEYESTDALTIISYAEHREHILADDDEYDLPALYRQVEQVNGINYHPTKRQIEEVFASITMHHLALVGILKCDTKDKYNASIKDQTTISAKTYNYIRVVILALCHLAEEKADEEAEEGE